MRQGVMPVKASAGVGTASTAWAAKPDRASIADLRKSAIEGIQNGGASQFGIRSPDSADRKPVTKKASPSAADLATKRMEPPRDAVSLSESRAMRRESGSVPGRIRSPRFE